ncbi:hypothetical protein [Streptomyces sp. NPDC058726]|uniref:pPIWI_RE_Z domain-containing protein n=1 Tax=Streptomyces sp. NPDC058726 TaxID=3346611 RepID=UPI0036BC7C0A
MRDRDSWYRTVEKDLARHWHEAEAVQPGVRISLLCQVELGLRLLERLDPARSADGVWVLLGGYPFARAAGLAVTAADEQLVTHARHLLWTLRRRRMWRQSLETYRTLPQRLLGYRLDALDTVARRVAPMTAGTRFDHYDEALEVLPGFTGSALPPAPAGRSTFVQRRMPASVTIPEEILPAPVPGHDLAVGRPGDGSPLSVTRDELAETARWMDTEAERRGTPAAGWAQRLEDLHLARRSDDGTAFLDSDVLRLDGLGHLVGMVGAGKSTLMTLIAVWAAQRGLRTTLVVGDVAEQLAVVGTLRTLALPATPVLGHTTRTTHVQRLHRRLAARGQDNLLTHDDPGFDDLGTACVVDALRGTEAAEPLHYADAPCTSLRPEAPPAVEPSVPGRYRPGTTTRGDLPASQEPAAGTGTPHGCPLWSGCPRHRSARELTDSLIWVANPASLVQSPLPRHLNSERIRHLELACLRSDIVIVDEADRVQMQLDDMFAPSATLVKQGPDSWLDQLGTHKIDELSRQGRLPLTERDVERWAAAYDVVSTAANRLYPLLIADKSLRDWADIEYFSAWTLQEKLLSEWYPPHLPSDDLPDGTPDDEMLYEAEPEDGKPEPTSPPAPEPTPWGARRAAVNDLFDAFRDDPLGDRDPRVPGAEALVRTTHDLLHTLDERMTRTRVRIVLDDLLDGSPALDGTLRPPAAVRGAAPAQADVPGSDAWRDRAAARLEFTLLLAALHQRLDRLTFLWPQVEAALHLDSTGNELGRRPPLDYAPLVPEAPMGNVLGFQFLPDDSDREQDSRTSTGHLRSGTLRFFRCAGVGRELLHALPHLGADPASGRTGPHVLLMSGTSWAGTSTRAHVLAPVTAVLRPGPEAMEAIRQTTFRTRFLYGADKRPLSLSGTALKDRPAVLREMVTKLAGPTRTGDQSALEDELARIPDEERRRALILVGSYREADTAAGLLEDMERWKGRVRVLAADDADLDDAVQGTGTGTDGRTHATVLRRGDLASFARDPYAQVLVAPLMAIERGHNILNKQRKAAFGTVLFLARPHPRPDDLGLAVLAVNDWVSRYVRDLSLPGHETFGSMVEKAGDLDSAGSAFRRTARQEWRRLLSRRYIYSRLDAEEKKSFTWDQLVTIWQVIGRLVRGGVPARVVFVDARFAPRLAAAQAPGSEAVPDTLQGDDGLLAGLRDVLAPYFAPAAEDGPDLPADGDADLVRLLYAPLHNALQTLNSRP